jgi:hypothetical protein
MYPEKQEMTVGVLCACKKNTFSEGDTEPKLRRSRRRWRRRRNKHATAPSSACSALQGQHAQQVSSVGEKHKRTSSNNLFHLFRLTGQLS